MAMLIVCQFVALFNRLGIHEEETLSAGRGKNQVKQEQAVPLVAAELQNAPPWFILDASFHMRPSATDSLSRTLCHNVPCSLLSLNRCISCSGPYRRSPIQSLVHGIGGLLLMSL